MALRQYVMTVHFAPKSSLHIYLSLAIGIADAMLISGNSVGETTSGCPSPSLGKGNNISMGYVDKKVNLEYVIFYNPGF